MKDADLLSETALVVTTNKEWGFYGMINRVLKNDELTAEVFNAVGIELGIALDIQDGEKLSSRRSI